ncbi:exosortase-associated EpsI family protein [Limnoglobus roseus]|uniref:Exosortase-associated EpsI family protein n=1 Tax=Limnoglobus roseus TaxID=2598579 RepID=A0A5C1AGV5_9BACT|nr:exosortase-associated EpsI family protein [Limnoglobus roseus]QEL17216.1 exosortase-associated EpsI family protein [Limnoglobus roseus]
MRAVVIGIAVVVLCGAGWLEVRTTSHRADATAIKAVQEKLDAVPLAVGDWKGEVQEYDSKRFDRTGAFAATSRVYRNAKTNEVVTALILAGAATEIGAHDPNRCYAGAGYRPIGPQQRRELDESVPGPHCTYWSARFDTDTFPAVSLQVNWAWSLDGAWTASEDARYEFGREPVLYKLYVQRRLNTLGGGAQAADPTEGFLAEFFPAAQSVLQSK